MNLELEILKQLEEAHPRKIKQSLMIAELGMELEGVTRTEIKRKLRVLESKEQIRIYAGEDVTRLAITTDGLDRVEETR